MPEITESPYKQFLIDEKEESPYKQFMEDSSASATVPEDAPDFIPGVKRGLQNLQASAYGATALAGKGLKELGAESVGQSIQDFGMEGYQRNIEEAKQYPAKHSFKDIYTGKTGIGGAVDWAQGTLGELVPSMAEAAIGAGIGSVVAPGPGTVAGGLAGRTLLKKGIDETVKQSIKRGIGDLTEAQVRKQLTGQALKKFGGKVGIAGSVMPLESGGMYSEMLQEKGIDAPETALLFGALATSLEFAGGNSKLVDTFVDALSKGSTGTVKRSAKELLTNIPQEALQEGGQELLSVLNTVANTDEKLLTADNVERIIESMAAGAIGGGAGAAVNAGFSAQAKDPGPEKTDAELELDRRATNILNLKEDELSKSVQTLNDTLNLNKEIIDDPYKLDQKARELNVDPAELIRKTVEENKNNQSLLDRINSGIQKKEELAKKEYETLSPEEKQVRDIENKLSTHRYESASQLNERITNIDKEITTLSEQYNSKFDPYALDAKTSPSAEERKVIEDKLITLNKRRNELLDKETPEVKKAFAPYTTRDGRQKYLEELFGTVNVGEKVGIEKDAAKSAEVIESEIVPKSIADYANQIIANKSQDRAALNDQAPSRTPEEEHNLRQIQDYVNYVKTYINNSFTPEERKIIENYWQGVKKELNLRQEEMTPGTEAFMRKKFFETQLANIEGNVKSDTASQVGAKQNVAPSLAEQNKRQAWFQQIAKDLGDVQATNRQAVQTEVPRNLPRGLQSGFTNEQQVAGAPQFQVSESKAWTTPQQEVSSAATSISYPTPEKKAPIIFSAFKEGKIKLGPINADIGGGKFDQITNWLFNKGIKNIVWDRFNRDDKHNLAAESSLRGGKADTATISNVLNVIPTKEGRIATIATAFDSIKNGGNAFFSMYTAPKSGEVKNRDSYQTGMKTEEYVAEIEEVFGKGLVIRKGNIIIATKQQNNNSQFQATENQEALGKVSLDDIKLDFPGQEITQSPDGIISVKFKNGQGLTINSIQNAGQGFVKLAIETGQMSKDGKILGITTGNEILLDENFADNKTLWHENKHVLDNLGLITEADDSALNREFNKLRKAGKLDFALSTYNDPKKSENENKKQRMVENRANMFAQIMVNRAEYRNTAFGKVIQRVMDFFQQMLSFGKQTVSGLAREVESGKLYDRQAEALREGMPMFEVREETVQKISDDVYQQMFSERNSLVRTIGQTLRMRGHEIKQLIDKGLGSISTRLKNVDPMLRSEIRNLDFRTAQKIVTALRIAHPLLDKTKQMSPQDKFVWDAARRNSDEVKIKEIAEKYNMTADQEKLRAVLDQIRQDAIDVGYDVGFIEEYWPRIIKDQEGFLQATKGISQRPVITDAIKVYADKLGMTVEKFEIEYPEQAADIASNTILGRNLGIGGPGNIQARQYETVPPELNKFYMDSDAALMQYIYSMTKKIEARRFFGKVPERIATLKTEKKRKQVMLTEYEKSNNATRIEDVSGDLLRIEQELDKYKLQRDYTENIGTYINDLRMSGRIQADDEKVVRDILDARFHEHGATGIVNAYKNMSYIDVMGSPISALTQIGDLAWAMYVGKVWTPRGLADTIKNVGKAITKKSEITKEDLGIERIAQEFADGTTLGNAVSWVFKKVQLERIDSIGKETLINNAFSNYKAMASTEAGRQALLKQIKPIFGTQSESVINDLLADNPTDNVKMLLYHRLLDFQPVALSEMSEQYLKSGNGRVFYMLKTYTLKQFDVFRNEAWHKIKTGERDQVIEGIGNMIKLVSLLTLANAGADELKDWMLGKETKFEDHVIENFLTMGGASKFVRMQTTREGLGSGLIGQILPPFRFVNSVSKDLNQLYGSYITGDTIDFDHARIVESIPIGGKIYYWHYGRGEDYKKSSNEQEFGKISKEVDIFKKQLENSEDKRTFLNSNLDGFKQMKLHENFQSALNRNQAVINKLKKIDQTTNVRERLGQLQQQREVILKRYFDVTNME